MAGKDEAMITWAQEAISTRLRGKRLTHSLSVADTAATLAEIYGVDTSYARIAGLLHDWDKQLSDEELIARVKELNVSIPSELLEMPVLLHAYTGAAALRLVNPQLPEPVLQAIERHTTASITMDPLDEIVYIADKIEPSRESRDAQFIREQVGACTLRHLFIESYGSTIIHLVKRQRYIYLGALEVWNHLVDEIRS